MRIALDIAEAIKYIHDESRSIMHRDINSFNILLGGGGYGYSATLTDFEDAIDQLPGNIKIPIVGSDPYIAPEYKNHRVITKKCDVYSFGVVLLELITGRKPAPEGEDVITDWARFSLVNKDSWDTLVPPMIEQKIRATVPLDDMVKVMKLALDCLQPRHSSRPDSSQVVDRLLKVSCLDPSAPFTSRRPN